MPSLPVDSATSCSAHRPNDAERLVDDEGELVAPVLGELAERDAEPEPGVRRSGVLAGLLRDLGGLQHRAHVDAQQRGRDEAEVRQRGVAPADLGVVLEHAPEAVLGAEAGQRGARVRDRGVVGAVALERVEELELRHRLDRPARLRGHDRPACGRGRRCRAPCGPGRGASSRARAARIAGVGRRSGGRPPARGSSRPCRAARRRCSRPRAPLPRTPRARRPGRPSARRSSASRAGRSARACRAAPTACRRAARSGARRPPRPRAARARPRGPRARPGGRPRSPAAAR